MADDGHFLKSSGQVARIDPPVRSGSGPVAACRGRACERARRARISGPAKGPRCAASP
jgi:hypothetical protein